MPGDVEMLGTNQQHSESISPDDVDVDRSGQSEPNTTSTDEHLASLRSLVWLTVLSIILVSSSVFATTAAIEIHRVRNMTFRNLDCHVKTSAFLWNQRHRTYTGNLTLAVVRPPSSSLPSKEQRCIDRAATFVALVPDIPRHDTWRWRNGRTEDCALLPEPYCKFVLLDHPNRPTETLLHQPRLILLGSCIAILGTLFNAYFFFRVPHPPSPAQLDHS